MLFMIYKIKIMSNTNKMLVHVNLIVGEIYYSIRKEILFSLNIVLYQQYSYITAIFEITHFKNFIRQRLTFKKVTKVEGAILELHK